MIAAPSLNGGKDIENRDLRTNFRGRVRPKSENLRHVAVVCRDHGGITCGSAREGIDSLLRSAGLRMNNDGETVVLEFVQQGRKEGRLSVRDVEHEQRNATKEFFFVEDLIVGLISAHPQHAAGEVIGHDVTTTTAIWRPWHHLLCHDDSSLSSNRVAFIQQTHEWGHLS